MRNIQILKTVIIGLLFLFVSTNTFSQEEKKSASVSAKYIKYMNENSVLNIEAKYKIKKRFEPCVAVSINIYNVDSEENETKIGSIKTDANGQAVYIIPNKYIAEKSNFIVKLEKDKIYEDTDESISVTDASIESELTFEGGKTTITAKLVDAVKKPIAEESLLIGLKRQFGNLPIGEDSYTTDEEGNVTAESEEVFYGKNKHLTFQVKLVEHEDYGTIITNHYTKTGKEMESQSTFDKRTMWSPPSKTPLFFLILPNILLIGIWALLTTLIINLFKIYKSKN